MTVTGIKEVGHTATTVSCCIGCRRDYWISHTSRVSLLTDTTRDALQLPLSHMFHTLYLHYQIAV